MPFTSVMSYKSGCHPAARSTAAMYSWQARSAPEGGVFSDGIRIRLRVSSIKRFCRCATKSAILWSKVFSVVIMGFDKSRVYVITFSCDSQSWCYSVAMENLDRRNFLRATGVAALDSVLNRGVRGAND